MSEYTHVLCPRCNSNIQATMQTKRLVSFGDSDGDYVGLMAKTPKVLWEHPRGSNTEECEDLDCGDPDCGSQHNFDKQKNRELVEDPSTELMFNYDWEYSEEEEEEVIKVTKLECVSWNCNWEMTVSSDRVSLEQH